MQKRKHNLKQTKSISMDFLYNSTQPFNENKSQPNIIQFKVNSKYKHHSKLKPLRLSLLHNNHNNTTTTTSNNYNYTNPIPNQINLKTIDMIVNNSNNNNNICKYSDINTNNKMKPLLLNYHHLINIKNKRNNSSMHHSVSVCTGIQKNKSNVKRMFKPILEVPHFRIHFVHKKDIELYQRKLNEISKMSNSLIREKIMNYYSKKTYGKIPTLPMLDNNKS